MNLHGIKNVLTALGVNKYYVRSSAEVDLSCPFAPWTHAGFADTRPSAGITINDNGVSLFNCFTCARKGTLHTMVRQLTDLDQRFAVALPLVTEERKNGLDYALEEALRWYQPKQSMARANDYAVRSEKELDTFPSGRKEVAEYMQGRGILPDAVAAWDCRYDAANNRAVFPVRDKQGKLVGLVGRALDQRTPAHHNYWHFRRGSFLFGEHKIVEESTIVVVEGVIDAIKISQFVANPVATFGAQVTDYQIDKLLSWQQPICLMFDGDEAGRKATKSVGDRLKGRTTLMCINLPEGRDPADLSLEQLRVVNETRQIYF